MDSALLDVMPRLNGLPPTLPPEGSICLELEQGVAIFRASPAVQARIEDLLEKQRHSSISPDEETELDQYEEIDDYLSFINRLLRNISLSQEANGDGLT